MKDASKIVQKETRSVQKKGLIDCKVQGEFSSTVTPSNLFEGV